MLAVRDRRTGKFLKTFSGSYHHRQWNTQYRLTITRKLPLQPGETWARYETVHAPTPQEVHDAMFCLPTPDGAKLYTGRAGVQNSIGGGHRKIVDPVTGYNRWESIPIEEGKPWIELVDVQTFERRRAAARKGAATRRKAKRGKAKPKRRKLSRAA